MKLSKNKSIFVFLVIVFVGFVTFWFIAQSNRGAGMDMNPIHAVAAQLVHNEDGIKGTVANMIQKGIKIEDLDFTLPNEPTYKPSDVDSVFGQGNVSPFQLFSESDLKALFDGQMQYVFTGANRISGVRTEASEILFITWPIKKDVCEYIDGNHGLGLDVNWIDSHILHKDWAENHILPTHPDLTPLHHETGKAVTELNIPELACVQDKNGVRYYIHTIVER